MTIKDYKKWKAGERVIKAQIVIDFYKTNPSDEQLRLWTKIVDRTLLIGIIAGTTLGFGFASIIFGF